MTPDDPVRKGRPRVNVEDATGSVRISFALIRDGKAVVGNCTRSMTKPQTTVTAEYERFLVNEQRPR